MTPNDTLKTLHVLDELIDNRGVVITKGTKVGECTTQKRVLKFDVIVQISAVTLTLQQYAICKDK